MAIVPAELLEDPLLRLLSQDLLTSAERWALMDLECRSAVLEGRMGECTEARYDLASCLFTLGFVAQKRREWKRSVWFLTKARNCVMEEFRSAEYLVEAEMEGLPVLEKYGKGYADSRGLKLLLGPVKYMLARGHSWLSEGKAAREVVCRLTHHHQACSPPMNPL